MAKKKNDIIISFADSESVNDVTGSSVHVNYMNNNILLECGMTQGGSMSDNYSKNNSNFKFKVKELDYVFILHQHFDHIGRLPLLYKRGCHATVILPTGSKELMYKMLSNSAMLLNGEAKILTKRKESKKEYSPIYEQCDVENMMNYVVEYDMYDLHQLNDDVRFKLISSAHVENATSLVLEIKKGQTYKKIYYTSDLGNIRYKTYYCNNMDKIKNADVVISESTYSTPEQSCTHRDQRERDMERLSSAIEQHDKVLIPVFSFHRGQSIATLLYEMYHKNGIDRNIYMDSMLLNDVSAIFKKKYPQYAEVLKWDRIKLIGKEERRSLQTSKEKMVVLSSSGMLSGGPSVSWLQSLVGSAKNCVVFCGYCGINTIGYRLKLKKQKTIKINGQNFKNRINVVKMKSFSSHIQHADLVDYLGSIRAEKVVLHHGSKSGKLSLKRDLEKVYEGKCMSNRVIVPCKSTKIRI